MTFSWTVDSSLQTFVAEGFLSPDMPINAIFEQQGRIYRTRIGKGLCQVVYSKWAITFVWNLVPASVQTALESMISSRATVALVDDNIGNYSLRLSANDFRRMESHDGLVSVLATFREV
jgi:hypothetical protein